MTAPTIYAPIAARTGARQRTDDPQSWVGRCPHCGRGNSLLAFDYGDGTATMSCASGHCAAGDITRALSLGPADTAPDAWEPDRAFLVTTRANGETEPAVALSTWAPVDMAAALADDYEPEATTILRRADGVCLFYPGRLHWLQGESESGKSWVALLAAKEQIEAGHRVLFLDFESDAVTVGRRLLALGVERGALLRHLTYVRPNEAPVAGKVSDGDFGALCEQRFALAVIDGTTDALMLFKYDQNKSDEVAAYVRRVPKRIADGTGAAVVQIDHVVKSSDGRGRFAIGSQHKMAALDGVAYVVEPKEPIAPGKRGTIVLRVAKDRPGWVRARSGAYRAGDRTQEAARIVLDSTAPGVTVATVEVPETFDAVTGEATAFKPTAIMERVSRHLEDTPEQSRTALRSASLGKGTTVADAISRLIEEGYVAERPRAGRGGGSVLVSLRPFREEVKPVPNPFQPVPGTGSTSPKQPVPVPPPIGGTGNGFGERLSDQNQDQTSPSPAHSVTPGPDARAARMSIWGDATDAVTAPY